MLEETEFDPINSRQISHWRFYCKYEKDLRFIDELDYNIHIYSSSELTELLARMGWRVKEIHGNLINGISFSNNTGMNIIAMAI